MPKSRSNPSNHHSVIDIGGPSFHSPLSTILPNEYLSSSPSSSSSSSSSYSSSSTTIETSSPSEELASPSTNDNILKQYQARVEYSQSLHLHTARMWETERSNIERAKLQGIVTNGSETSNSLLRAAAANGADPSAQSEENESGNGNKGGRGWRIIPLTDLVRGRSRARRRG
ncbi:hypothetical protein IE53DRAFT_388064 [Violaceomyces palustris]|uniref:Uncharacterized protein n=1 Tax=Violaceomyces palustris TaxID=1673888 RepID=A0ACD0NV98_9BASI|nr:hypothetical protein IE53DRAFT_388064 [Violaceomyces palustris]